MYFKHQKAIILLIGILLLSVLMPTSMATNGEKSNTFQAQYKLNNQRLYVSVPPSLYDYYGNMSHTVNSDSDYAKFVTPQAVEPIAASIQNITRNLPHSNEQFADSVLTLVHQIPYAINAPAYPIETIVNNSGDCVALSLLAASIMEAGGLDVVLIHYTGITPGHMNVGVYLPYTPIYHTAGMAPTDFVYNNKTYWTAEATSAEGWKIGDQSESLANAKPVIIPLANTEQSSPAQVSSSLGVPPLSSTITINLSQSSANISQEQSSLGENPRALKVSGSISPTFSGKSVSIYVSNGSAYNYLKTITDSTGNYNATWNFTSAGTYYIMSSWSGTSNYAGEDSERLTVFVGPESFVQFGSSNYDYILGQASLGVYQIRPLQGVNNFLSIPLGTAVSFSYSFTIVKARQTVSNIQTKNTTISGSEQTVYRGKTPYMTTQMPGENITMPVNVPVGMVPLILPADFNQMINNQFCFILQNNYGNYSLNVRGLNNKEMSTMTIGNGNNTVFMNATQNIKQNCWYNVTETISDNGISANLYNTNGALLKNMVTPYNATKSNVIIIFITNNVDSAIILKDLTVKALNNITQPPESNENTTGETGLLFLHVALPILLLASFSVTVVYIEKKRKNERRKNVSVAKTCL